MGNRPICFLGDRTEPVVAKPQFKKASSKEERDLINYIASYKPGRKLIFPTLYYNEGNSLSKLIESKRIDDIERLKNKENSEEKKNEVVNEVEEEKKNIEEEEEKIMEGEIMTKIIDRDSSSFLEN